MKTTLRETLVFLASLSGGILLFTVFCGFPYAEEGSTADINLHDTYFIISSRQLLLALTILWLYVFNLIRILLFRFRRNPANWIFSLVSLVFLLGLASLIIGFRIMSGNSADDDFSSILNPLYCIFAVVTLLAMFVIYRISVNKKIAVTHH